MYQRRQVTTNISLYVRKERKKKTNSWIERTFKNELSLRIMSVKSTICILYMAFYKVTMRGKFKKIQNCVRGNCYLTSEGFG